MATAHPHTGHHLDLDRVLAAVLAVLVVVGVVAAAVVTIDWSTSDTGTTVEQPGAPPSIETLDHAARVASAARELHALRNVVVTVPPIGPALAEDIALLELVTSGQLPVEAAERTPTTP